MVEIVTSIKKVKKCKIHSCFSFVLQVKKAETPGMEMATATKRQQHPYD
jgi:hypothetical protein